MTETDLILMFLNCAGVLILLYYHMTLC